VTGALLGEPAGFDPVAARTAADVAVTALVFDTLYRVGPDGRIAPHLAAALPEVVNGKSHIAIRPGAHFHNGAALGAADVAASLARVKDAPAGWLLAGIDDIAVDGDAVVLGTTAQGSGPAPGRARHRDHPARPGAAADRAHRLGAVPSGRGAQGSPRA
jgi:ABC-type transport system substrate-binding protein